jgi:hypothetical protein
MLLERGDVVSYLLKMNGGTRYLEVGVADGVTYNRIVAPFKHGIDPRTPHGTHMMTSDQYFEQAGDLLFDCIFIDGLHTQEQVSLDIENGLRHLSPKGYLVMHDMLPPDLEHERPDRCGTCWRAVAERRCTDPHYVHVTLDIDYGVGVARRDTAVQLPLWERPEGGWSYDYLMKRRDELMNVISEERFRRLFQ